MNRTTASMVPISSHPRTAVSGGRLPALGLLLALQATSPFAMAADPLDTAIQQLVSEYRTEHKIPGLTVSVRRDGVELFADGYGTANTYTAMTANTRTLIGSVTKAAVTGPSGYKAIAESNQFTLASKLYGFGGVFGQKFASDLTVGVQRHTPVVGMAIGTTNKVFTWYMNGIVSVGSSNFLGQTTMPYSLPPGRKPADIVGSAIDGAGRVHTWYRRGNALTRSVGVLSALDAVLGETTPCGSTPVPGCVDIKMPADKSIDNIVGIAMVKSNGNVYAWYDDGTVSRGHVTDFGAYAAPKAFTTPPGLTPYDLREIDIATNNHVYAWYRNGEASSGYSLKLDHHHPPYAYAIPEAGYAGTNWYAWYAGITLQNLLQHRAGFTHSGDTTGTGKMFGKEADNVSYEEVHRHFLRTRPLLAAPGTATLYSNHGFGLWTLLMPAIAGKSFTEYARNHYLKPMGMDNLVVLASATPAQNDAAGYTLDGNGNPEILPFKPEPSPAAGGYRASARSLTLISSKLLADYGWSELPKMGWQGAGNGRLGHEGALDGGNALVLLYPDGKWVRRADMSGIHVAIATNLWNATDERKEDMYALAEAIASKVAAAK